MAKKHKLAKSSGALIKAIGAALAKLYIGIDNEAELNALVEQLEADMEIVDILRKVYNNKETRFSYKSVPNDSQLIKFEGVAKISKTDLQKISYWYHNVKD